MNTAVTRRTEGSIRETVLYMALELSDRKWMLAFTTGMGQKPRIRQVPARDLAVLAREVEKAKRRFGPAAATRVLSCYEAGMDGFWVHRFAMPTTRKIKARKNKMNLMMCFRFECSGASCVISCSSPNFK
jgi:hypothetical protein